MKTFRFSLLVISILFPFLWAAGQEQPLLDERFYNNSNAWPEYTNDDNSCRVNDGAYEAEVMKADGTWMGSIVLALDDQRDFTIETTTERISGIDNYGYGVAWGIRDVNNFYYFNITGNGYYEYGKCENAKYTEVVPWATSSAIQTTTSANPAVNKLTVKKVGGQLSFYINDTYVAQSPAQSFYGRKIGFGVYRQMKVRFKTLRVIQASPAAGESVALHDDFNSNANSWTEADDESHYEAVTHNALVLEGKLGDKAWFNCVPVSINAQSDYTITAAITKISGDETNGYGLAWGYADGRNVLMFKIAGTGYYQVVKRVNGIDENLIPWEKTDAVVTSNGTNTLALKKVNNQFEVYVNDRFMKSIAAEQLPGGQVGFVIDRLIRIEASHITVTEGNTGVISYSKEQTLLDEEFQNNVNHWDISSGADVDENIRNGRYVFEEKRPEGSRLSTVSLDIPEHKDFTIESSFTKVSGVDNYGFGLVWGLKDSQNFFHFLITGNGHYLYGKCVNGTYNESVDWTPSDAINDYNARNKLTVRKSGSSVSIFINDTYVNTFPFESFFGNGVGFVNHHPKNMEIENLIVKTSAPQAAKQVSTQLDGKVVLQDDFTTNANEWYEADNEMVKLKREYGKYVFEHKRTIGGYVSWMPTSLDAYADFTITTSIRKVSGVDNYGYGLIWGVKDNKNYYYFLISANGNYIYGKSVDGVSNILTEWTASSDILQTGEANQLKVKKTGNDLALIINDKTQKTVTFDGAFGNYVGFKIDNNVGIEITNILVTQNSESATSPRKQITKDTTPPVITILEPEVTRGMKAAIKEKSMLVRGRATDESGVFDVTVNDDEARISETGEFEAEIKLKVGENTITVRATDIKNNVAEQHFTILRESTPIDMATRPESEPTVQSGKFYALLIGVQNYQDKSVNALDHPIADAQQLQTVLTHDYTFDKANTTLLKDPDRKAIIHAFNDMKNRLTANDNLLVFYAGHGYWDQDLKQGFWLPSDATSNDPSDWISNGTIRDFVRGIKAKHVLLVADACFSGGIFKTRQAFTNADLSIQKTYEMASRRAISSGALKAVPDRSVFVEYLLKRLKENKEKYLLAEKLYVNMKEAVINNSPNNQTPLYGVIGEAGDEGGDFILVRR